jgi:photosystem II stability/assembly factor-like uncharacterized protein
MKKFSVMMSMGVVLISCFTLFAQWIEQDSKMPADVTAYRMSIVDQNIVWACGQKSQLAPSPDFTRTIDGGAHWQAGKIPLPADFFILNISAFSADTAWAAAAAMSYSTKAGVYKTSDGGKTWKQQFVAPSFILFVYFFNSSEGLAFCEPAGASTLTNAIYTTLNGGDTWEPALEANKIALAAGEGISHSLYYIAGDVLYTGSSKGRIFITRDKGKNWSARSTGFSSFVWPAFQDSLNGLVSATTMSTHYGMAKTHNGGQSWEPVSSPGFLAYWPASIPKTAAGYVVTGTGWNLGKTGSAFTLDSGMTWTMMDDVAHLWTEFYSADLGWGGDGNSNKIYKWNKSRQPSISRYPASMISFGSKRVGSVSESKNVTLTNYGQSTLIVSDIIHPSPHFQLVRPPSLPLTLESLQSLTLQVCFSPQTSGVLKDSCIVVSNAANSPRTSIVFEGTGAVVTPVRAETIYAVSQTALYTLDANTGKATRIGPLGITQVQGLAVHPISHTLMAASTNNTTMGYYDVDSQTGSTLPIRTASISNTRAVTFKADTLYAASLAGKFYRINLSTGQVFQIGTATNIGYFSLAVHPSTQQIYASARSTLGTDRDRIFTVNSATGDTALVGSTGDNALTPGIAFAASGVLYGLKGTGTAENTLIKIDPATGAASIVGPTGVSGLQAIAMDPSPVSVNVQSGMSASPEEFELKQNYPNPFNPSTTIEFSLRAPGYVSLQVFTVLGQKVADLVHNRLPAGVHRTIWNGNGHANGMYYYVLEVAGRRLVRKTLLIR